MGRKVNPKGLRLGVSRGWDWYCWSKDKNVDHEILKIIEYITTTLESLGYMVGALNIQITRSNVGIYIALSNVDIKIGEPEIKVLVEKIKDESRKIIKKSIIGEHSEMEYEVKINFVDWLEYDVILLTKWMVNEIEQGAEVMELRDILAEWYKENEALGKYIGMKGKVSGRMNGVEMAQIEKFSFGKVTTQTLKNNIDFYQKQAFTVSGVIGVSLWLASSQKPLNKNP